MDVCNKVNPNGTVHRGTCSNYLASLKEGDMPPTYIRKSTFR
jgi:sulfite reductase alpha subunit-like flavoprotein